MRQVVQIGLGDRAYEVVIGPGLIARAGQELAGVYPRGRTVIVADQHVADLHGRALIESLKSGGIAAGLIVLPPGEETKSFEGLADLSNQLLKLRLDRGDVITAFGGGVIGDLTGFAAAIYKRGIDFVQIPTTLLAQVDSSVGGKTAIDTPLGKNLIGAFHQPRRVLADLDVLKTLPTRELRCGYAEIIKYGLLGDFAFFEQLERDSAQVLALEPRALAHAVNRSVEMKAEIVAEDETEQGRRALLNLGHTFGHALEGETGFGGALLHGEAVGVGMALAFRFSAMLGLCSGQDAARAAAALAAAGLPTRLADVRLEPFSVDRLISHMTQDKKAEGGRLTLVLVHAIGDAFVAKGVEPDKLRRFLLEEGAL
jgi:3-dehydroquinate synthase